MLRDIIFWTYCIGNNGLRICLLATNKCRERQRDRKIERERDITMDRKSCVCAYNETYRWWFKIQFSIRDDKSKR